MTKKAEEALQIAKRLDGQVGSLWKLYKLHKSMIADANSKIAALEKQKEDVAKLERTLTDRIAKLEKTAAEFQKREAAWEKSQTDWVKRIEKGLIDALSAQRKSLAGSIDEGNKYTYDLHMKQDKKFVDEINKVYKWVEKEFDKKGIFQ